MTMVLPLGWQVVDANGNPYSGAKAYFYATGTSTPQATYSNAALSAANANPLVADASGRFGPAYGQTTTDYKVILKTSADVTIATYDPVQMSGAVAALSVDTDNIAANAVTLAKMADIATSRILGRSTSGTGDPEALTGDQAGAIVTPSPVLNQLSGTPARGDLPMRGASDWAVLHPGTAGYMLNSAGAGADLVWGNNGIRAHASFNGTGTPAFYGTPYNCTSITDNGTGSWTPNFTSALPSANFTCTTGISIGSGNNSTRAQVTNKTTGSVTLTANSHNSADATVYAADAAIVDFICVGG
jgi:hypothetical protein